MTMARPGGGDRAIEPIVVCLFGQFRVLRKGVAVVVRRGGKVEQLLGSLALNARSGIPREDLLGLIWPDSDGPLAGQSLNSLVYSVHKTFGASLAGDSPVVEHDGRYRLNLDGGVGVDILQFDTSAEEGDRLVGAGDTHRAIEAYQGAIDFYSGDLVAGEGVQYIIERERLRARLLYMWARLADMRFDDGDYEGALENALRLLARDPCREDAHRMAMRCYVRLGARAQALRQYQICRQILVAEFDAPPEESTERLYELVRLDPGRI
jgi:DNA-binding SARP family transcriptional activator